MIHLIVDFGVGAAAVFDDFAIEAFDFLLCADCDFVALDLAANLAFDPARVELHRIEDDADDRAELFERAGGLRH